MLSSHVNVCLVSGIGFLRSEDTREIQFDVANNGKISLEIHNGQSLASFFITPIVAPLFQEVQQLGTAKEEKVGAIAQPLRQIDWEDMENYCAQL